MPEAALQQNNSRFQLPVTTYTTIQLLLLLFSLLHNFFSFILFAFNSSHRTLFPTCCLSTLFYNCKQRTGGQQEEKNLTPTTATYLLGQKQIIGGNEHCELYILNKGSDKII